MAPLQALLIAGVVFVVLIVIFLVYRLLSKPTGIPVTQLKADPAPQWSSYTGTDITPGLDMWARSNISIDDAKALCLATTGCRGFVYLNGSAWGKDSQVTNTHPNPSVVAYLLK